MCQWQTSNEKKLLIADVNMGAMIGIELYRHFIDAGHSIPTIIVIP
jgi:FixJ family two-component response regulator